MSGHEPGRDLPMADDCGAHGGISMQIDIVAQGRVHYRPGRTMRTGLLPAVMASRAVRFLAADIPSWKMASPWDRTTI